MALQSFLLGARTAALPGRLAGDLQSAYSYGIEMLPSSAAIQVMVAGASTRITNYKVPLQKAIKDVMQPSFQLNFDTGGRNTWAPLSADTVRQKLAKNSANPEAPLIDNGQLMDTTQVDEIWKITKDQASISSNDLGAHDYGVVHQLGSETNNTPERPFLLVQNEDQDKMQEIFGDWLMDQLAEVGLIV